MNIKFEVGKYYRTANGMKVRVVATDGVFPDVIVGIVENKFNGHWSCDGTHSLEGFDIISEWIDKPQPPWAEVPKWFNWFAMDEDCTQYYFQNEPAIGTERWFPNQWVSEVGEILKIPPDHRIPVTCNWKDSLVERLTV